MVDKIKRILSNKYYSVTILLILGVAIFLLSTIKVNDSEYVFNQNYVTSLEKRIESILTSIENAGECDVMINCIVDNNDSLSVTGAVITCKGGNIPRVKESVTDAVCSLLGIGANNVCVIAKQ